MRILRNARLGTLLAAVAGIAVASVVAPGRAAYADSTGDTMHSLAGKYRGAAVMLTVIVHTSGTGADDTSDTEINVPGFFVDPSGLVVTTDVAIDPASIFAALMPEGSSKVTTKVVSAKILTADQTVIPAQVVLRDSDRNIAFVRPIKPPSAPVTFVDLTVANEAHIGDAVFTIGQMGKTANHALAVTPLRVIAVMEHPRTLYIPNMPESVSPTSVGLPVFTDQGTPLGMLSLRFTPVRGGREGMMNPSDFELPVIIPAADVAEEIKQALTAKAPPPTPTAPAKTPAKPATKPK